MWEVKPTPLNYFPPDGEPWCIIDTDGDVWGFYFTKEEAEKEFEAMKNLTF